MAITVGGKTHRTMKEAAAIFEVRPKTVYAWIAEKAIPEPPRVVKGRKEVMVFPDAYMDRALASLRRKK